MAIISNDIVRYSEVLKSAFKRYDIPYFLSIEKSVDHTAVMVFFTTLIDLLGSKKMHSEQIFRMLKTGLLDVELTETALLENYCYKWDIDGDVWEKEFTAEDNKLEIIERVRNKIITPIIKLKK